MRIKALCAMFSKGNYISLDGVCNFAALLYLELRLKWSRIMEVLDEAVVLAP